MSRPDYPPAWTEKLKAYPRDKRCKNKKCKAELHPNIYKNNYGTLYLEPLSSFLRRGTCNKACDTELRRQRAAVQFYKSVTQTQPEPKRVRTQPKRKRMRAPEVAPRHLNPKTPSYLRDATTEFCNRWGVRIPIEATAGNTEALYDWSDTVQRYKLEYQLRQQAA